MHFKVGKAELVQLHRGAVVQLQNDRHRKVEDTLTGRRRPFGYIADSSPVEQGEFRSEFVDAEILILVIPAS